MATNEVINVGQIPEGAIEAVIQEPNELLGLLQNGEPFEPQTAEDNGYIKHLRTEVAIGGGNIDEYEHSEPLKQVIFAFWNEGYSGSFAGYARVALIHWIRTLTLQHINKLVNGQSDAVLNWVAEYELANAESLQDKDLDGMFANATRKQLESLAGTTFKTIAELDLFMKYLESAIGFQLFSPLTGEDSEWVDQTEASGGNPTFQNNRCSSVFKAQVDKFGPEIVPYFLDGFVFSDDQGMTWFTGSRSPVQINFPYTPRTVYTYVQPTDDGAYEPATGWSKEPAVGMVIRHHEGTIYEIVGIVEGYVGLRDNNRQMTTQIPLADLTKVFVENEISYPNYYPTLTPEEIEDICAKRDAEREEIKRNQTGPIVGCEPIPPMPEDDGTVAEKE